MCIMCTHGFSFRRGPLQVLRLIAVCCFCSASHVVLLLVKKYPKYKIVNLDRLDCK
jgi:hypothetical protein